MDEWYNKSMKMLNICIMIDMNNCLSLDSSRLNAFFPSFAHPSLSAYNKNSFCAQFSFFISFFLEIHFFHYLNWNWKAKPIHYRIAFFSVLVVSHLVFMLYHSHVNVSSLLLLLLWLISMSLSFSDTILLL